MLDKILSALHESGVELYQITETKEESAELFFIRKSLDMQRRKVVYRAKVTVYKDFTEGEKRMLGSAVVLVQDSFTMEEMVKMFRDALYAAGFVKNPYYELYAGKREPSPEVLEKSRHLSDKSLTEVANCFADALFAEDTREEVFLNSAEIFVTKDVCRTVNSSGVDVSWTEGRVKGEFVAQCTAGQDVETYQDFTYDDMDTDALKKKVREILDQTLARAQAVSAPPAGEYRVILSGDYVRELLSYYVDRSNMYMIYPKYSSFQTGCDVQGGTAQKDRINLTLKATVPYSEEGIPMKDRELVTDGKLQLLHGSNRFAYYLKEEPTGQYESFKVPAGSVGLEELRSVPYLEVVNFSDFQMDSFSGHFGGEIRLAFLYDGEKRIPVTGGSINGSILEAQKEFVFSSETQTEANFEGPKAVCLAKVRVAGSAEE